MNGLRVLLLLVVATGAVAAEKPGEAAYVKGKAALARNDADAAIDAFREAAKANALSADYHFQLGVAWSMKAEQGNVLVKAHAASRMREEWERAVELDPNHYDARESLYQFYTQAPLLIGGSAEKAVTQREAMLRIAPFRAGVYFGNEDVHARRYREAIMRLDPLVRASRGRIEPLIPFVLALEDTQRFAEAWAALDAAENPLHAQPQFAFLVGRTAAMSGQRLDSGASALNGLIASTPPSSKTVNVAAAHYRLGMILERQRNLAGARAEYEIALKLAPANEEMRRALDHLKGQ
jgi:tetratricopeptide (TPR) repeat protein